jgi:methyl-accepting chemotaxis protein
MIQSQGIEKASDVLKSLDELATQAQTMTSNLAQAASLAKDAGNIPTRVYDDILNLIDQTGRATSDVSKIIRVVKMEVGRLYRLSRHGEIELEKNRELVERVEQSLEAVLTESQRVLYMVKKLKTVSANNKLIP